MSSTPTRKGGVVVLVGWLVLTYTFQKRESKTTLPPNHSLSLTYSPHPPTQSQSKVRVEAVKLVRAAMCVPYKGKCRGAGTDCVVDLIGYTAEDTIPIAAFYGRHTQVNYLAELTVDPVNSVRLEVRQRD